ncbi:MAG: hypothetical protein ACYDHG_15970 [Desulfomonilaceae bacterium]
MNQICPQIRNCVHRNHAAAPLKHNRRPMGAQKLFIRVMFHLCCISTIWSSQMCFAGDNRPDCDASQLRMVTALAAPSVKRSDRNTQEIFDGTIDSANGSDQQRSTSGGIKEKGALMNPFWGQIVDSPSGVCALYHEKDIVYIRCVDSKRGLVREGDRFAIFSDSLSTIMPATTFNSSDSRNVALGEIEITSAGSDLITGIILECRSFICNGSQISPLLETTIEPPYVPMNEIILSLDGHKS